MFSEYSITNNHLQHRKPTGISYMPGHVSQFFKHWCYLPSIKTGKTHSRDVITWISLWQSEISNSFLVQAQVPSDCDVILGLTEKKRQFIMFLKSCLPATAILTVLILKNTREIQNMMFQCHRTKYLYLFLPTRFTPSEEVNSVWYKTYAVNNKSITTCVNLFKTKAPYEVLTCPRIKEVWLETDWQKGNCMLR